MANSIVDSLLEQVKQLPPHEREQFAARFAQWQIDAASDDRLIEATRESLAPADAERLRKLVANSEQGLLSAADHEQYLSLARRAEQLDVKRALALAELARRWKKPAQSVMREIGWEPRRHGA
jgi:hypothetical protein